MAKIKKIDDELNLASEARKTATDKLNNMSYDNFKQGSMYQGLQKDYAQQGQQAMKDTLGQVAARTGGMASSYATSAANQSYNNYMRQLEDVARAMYNDEYSKVRDKVSLAQSEYDRLYGEKRDAILDQRYDDEQAYLRSRDEITDQRYFTDKEEERVKNAAYYGNAPDYATYKANGGTLSERDYNSLVAIGEGMSADAHYEQNLTNKATKDSELKGIFGAEGFLWGDWDGDGKVGTEDTDGEVDAEGNPITFEDLYGGSSYGEEYWKAYADEAAKGYSSASQKQAQNDVIAIWATGGTPTAEQLAAAGWADDSAPGSEDGTIPAGLSALGQAYYKQATAAPAEEEPVTMTTDEYEYWVGKFSGVDKESDAKALRNQMIIAVGDTEMAYELYYQWEKQNNPGGQTTTEN